MPATLQSQVVQLANNLMSAAVQAGQLKATIDQITGQWTQLSAGGVLNAMTTTVVNTDGSLGTADGSPNNAHVIDTRVNGGTNLSRAISANDLATLNTGLTALSTLLAGSAVTQQGGMPQLLAKVTGG